MDGMSFVGKVLALSVMISVLAPGLGFQNAVLLGAAPGLSLHANGIAGMPGDSEQSDTRDQSRSNEGVALKTPKSRAVSATETEHILKKTKHSLDPELSRQTSSQAFDLAGGRVLLLLDDGNGRLYESKKALQAMLDEGARRAARGPESLCHDFPQGRAFAEQIPQLVRQLAKELHLDPAQLDGSEKSLDKVDKALWRMNPERALSPEVFAPLTAYVGEVLRKATQGRWEMRRASDADKTWEPWIVDPSGRSCPPFLIYKEIMENERSASVRGWVAGTLATWQLRPAQPGSTPP
jgi:hypothetical protein